MQFASYLRSLAWAAVVVLASTCQAQVMQPPGTMPDGQRVPFPRRLPNQPGNPPATNQAPNTQGTSKPPAAIMTPPGAPGQPAIQVGATATAAATTPNLPPSLGDKPAGPARITLNTGSLAVDANNSSLSQILKDLGATGMSVDGFEKDTRVFGVYGPGQPSEVIAELLDGAGYNFMMVGETDAGTPREVILTARSDAPISAPQPVSPQQQEEEEEPPPPPQQMEEPLQPRTPPGTTPPGDQQRPRTPQEMLQELQRLRQEQQQGQPQQATPQ